MLDILMRKYLNLVILMDNHRVMILTGTLQIVLMSVGKVVLARVQRCNVKLIVMQIRHAWSTIIGHIKEVVDV